jgi:NAD(P)-dependent dehydrogenase (short-subunit alcohol dehydrogenase family)
MSPLAPSLLETSEVLFDKVIGVNLKGPTRLTALAADAMKGTGGGSIVNISSLASVKPLPTATVYSAAKAGLNALTKAAALEYAGVGVNGIICGTFDTARRRGLRAQCRPAAGDRPADRARQGGTPRGSRRRGGVPAVRRI